MSDHSPCNADKPPSADHVPGTDATMSFTPDLANTAGMGPVPSGGPSGAAAEPDDVPDIPGYRVLAEIAHGGMGRVFAAHDLALDREVAIKVLLPGMSGAAADRFVRESKITAKVPHPGIPPVHALGTLRDGSPFLAMKLIAGQTLARELEIADRGRLLQVFEQVCHAVGFAHSRGIVHRDLKPANIMVGSFAEVQVMDWGLAKELSGSKVASEALPSEAALEPVADTNAAQTTAHRMGDDSTDDRTQAGQVMGTPAYMPPEQARGDLSRIGRRSDVFALGGILCVVLTGKPPYHGHGSQEVIQKAAAGDLGDALVRLDSCGADDELVSICKQCLRADPADRPADGSEVAERVAAYRAGVEQRLRDAERERAVAEAKAAEQRKRRRVQLALVAAVGVLLLGGGAVVWRMDKQSTERRFAEARNTQATESLLTRCEEALRAGDTAAAEMPLAEAEQRAKEGGTDVLAEQLTRCRTDRDLLVELDQFENLRLSVLSVHGTTGIPWPGEFRGVESAIAKLPEIFERLGIVVGKTPLEEAAARLNQSIVKEKLLAALDMWLALDPGRAAEVAAIARTVDPDKFRDAVRDAIVSQNQSRLLELAEEKEATRQPSRFAVVFGQFETIPGSRRLAILSASSISHPRDAGLLIAAARTYPINIPKLATERLSWSRAAVAAHPGSTAAWNFLAIDLHDSGNLVSAVAAFRAALRINPDDALIHHNLGVSLQSMLDFDGAIAAYREAIRIAPKSGLAYWRLGSVLNFKGDSDGAITALKDGLRLYPMLADPSLYLSLGKLLAGTGDLDGALTAYTKAIQLDPQSSENRETVQKTINAMGGLHRVIARLREDARLDPNSPGKQMSLGSALRVSGDLEGAVEAYRQAVRLDPKNLWAFINLERTLRERGDIDGAIAAGREAIVRNPKFHLSHNDLGFDLLLKGDVDGAIAAVREALRLYPKVDYSWSLLGDALTAKGDPDGAVTAYREAIRLNPRNGYAHAHLGHLLKAKGDLAGAVEAYREAVRVDPKNPGAYVDLERALRDRGDIDGAIAVAREAIGRNPNFALSHNDLGFDLLLKGDVDGAITAVQEALRLNPKADYSWSLLGDALAAKGEPDGAITAYRDAIRHNPRNGYAYAHLGHLLKAKGDVDGAVEAYRKAVRVDPKNTGAYVDLERTLRDCGDIDGAIAVAREAIGRNPKFALSHNDLGFDLLLKGDVDGAITAIQEALRLNPKADYTWSLLGDALAAKGDPDGAITAYRDAIRLNPRNGYAHAHVGPLLKAKGDIESAVEAYRQAIQLDPLDANSHSNLGEALGIKEDLDGAIAACNEALRLDPKLARAQNHLGFALQQRGDLDGAISEFREALRLDPKQKDAAANLPRAERMRELLPRLPDVLAGRTEPKTPTEACDFAQLCAQAFQKRYAAAARLYERAFAADPKLANNSAAEHRHAAACCAALAGCAQGIDPPMDPAARAVLRAQALTWLRADLVMHGQRWTAAGSADRLEVAARMTCWLSDKELNGTRPDARREGWSAQEMTAWDEFWSQVRATLAKAKEPSPKAEATSSGR